MLYKCEICGHLYRDIEEAQKCEARGYSEELVKVGDIIYFKDCKDTPILYGKLYEYLEGLTDIYTIAGSVFNIPVHATVIIFDFSMFPQETITAGIGYINVPGFHIVFAIFLHPFFFNSIFNL